MDFSPAERARIVVRYLAKKQGITQAEIGVRLGYSNKSAFSAVLNGQKTLPVKFGDKLAALDDEINPDFLAGMSDEMLRPEFARPPVPEIYMKQQERPTGVYLPLELVKMFTDLSDTIRSQQETIRQLVGKKESDAKAI